MRIFWYPLVALLWLRSMHLTPNKTYVEAAEMVEHYSGSDYSGQLFGSMGKP
jgi:hypothetical protein